jgi:hypothetical protein
MLGHRDHHSMNPQHPTPSDQPDEKVPGPLFLQIDGTTKLEVELMTAQGCVFHGSVTAVDVKMTDGSMQISSPTVTYLNLANVTELVLRSDLQSKSFQLKNAVASFREGKLTVVAEAIHSQVITGRN